MKKSLARKITLCILAGAVLMSSSVVWARDITNVAPDGSGGEWDVPVLGTYVPKDENSIAPSASNNNVEFNSSFSGTVDVDFAGGYSASGDVEKNTVTISGGKFGDSNTGVDVYGGYSNTGSNTGSALHNEVVISSVDDDSIFGVIYGGFVNGTIGSAENNIVTLSAEDASYSGNIIGGFAKGSGNAEGNVVTISGGKFNGIVVYGGQVDNSSSSAINNTVNIGGTADLSNANLFGGSNTEVGNVLNVGYDEGVDDVIGGTTVTGYKSWTNHSSQNRTISSISNFQKINFNNINWSHSDTVLSVGTAWLNDTTIGDISIIGGTVKNGEYMNLISATNSITGMIDNIITGNSADIDVTVYQGVANKIILDGKLEQVDSTTNGVDDVIKLTINDTNAANGITAKAPSNSGGVPGSSELNPQVLVIGESRTAATAFTNQGSELIETGLNALARDNEKDTKVFAAVYGNHSEYETGSHVNVNGWSGIVGIGKTNANGLTVGAFFENGEGNYSTHNIFTDDYIRGDGEACYNGGGFLVRKDNANGVYTEASLRAGNLQNELRNAVLAGDKLAGYDIDTFYYGAHVGIGKVIPRGNDGDSIDVYGKFIYTHHSSEDFNIDGSDFHFDSVDSERLRLGFRINEVQSNKLSMYYGAAWEYELGGDAENTTVGYDLSTPSLEGSTVIGEVGMHYKASDKWSIDLSARAYTGQREGFSGSVQANYSF